MRQILIVDDSGSMRQLLAEASLGFGGVEVTEAADGLDAIKRMATARFDLMFVDVNMPMLDGFKLIQRVRQSREHRDTLICVCTTEAESEAQVRQLGADYFLLKPVRRRDVEAMLHKAMPDMPGPTR